MPFKFTNLTQSNVNIPFNNGSKPKFTVPPDSTVLLTAQDLDALDADAKNRLLNITSGKHPIFKVEEVQDAPVATGKKKGKQNKQEAEPELVVLDPDLAAQPPAEEDEQSPIPVTLP